MIIRIKKKTPLIDMLNREGTRWELWEIRTIVDGYLKGVSPKQLGLEVCRSEDAVKDLLIRYIPQNKKKCVTKNYYDLSMRGYLKTKKKWSNREEQFLKLLLKKGRSLQEVSVLLQRLVRNVKKKLKEMTS